mmetsp:Transcript_18873/g.33745  ORF Transcript_18873/g.33745 Transcript_18873/m.33745 type:complete len:237 (-) Transcript_18873:1146-1856(-)
MVMVTVVVLIGFVVCVGVESGVDVASEESPVVFEAVDALHQLVDGVASSEAQRGKMIRARQRQPIPIVQRPPPHKPRPIRSPVLIMSLGHKHSDVFDQLFRLFAEQTRLEARLGVPCEGDVHLLRGRVLFELLVHVLDDLACFVAFFIVHALHGAFVEIGERKVRPAVPSDNFVHLREHVAQPLDVQPAELPHLHLRRLPLEAHVALEEVAQRLALKHAGRAHLRVYVLVVDCLKL